MYKHFPIAAEAAYRLFLVKDFIKSIVKVQSKIDKNHQGILNTGKADQVFVLGQYFSTTSRGFC